MSYNADNVRILRLLVFTLPVNFLKVSMMDHAIMFLNDMVGVVNSAIPVLLVRLVVGSHAEALDSVERLPIPHDGLRFAATLAALVAAPVVVALAVARVAVLT